MIELILFFAFMLMWLILLFISRKLDVLINLNAAIFNRLHEQGEKKNDKSI